jgi:hypothetical protein
MSVTGLPSAGTKYTPVHTSVNPRGTKVVRSPL